MGIKIRKKRLDLIGNNYGFKRKQIPWNKGIPASQATKEKISILKKGQIPWNKEIKGYKIRVKSPRYTQAQKDKISATLKRKYASGELVAVIPKPRLGAENNLWKGGDARFKCIDCGKQLSSYVAKRCVKCSGKATSGENHHNWKGGISPINYEIKRSEEYNIWRKSIYEKDNWICQICGKKCGKDIVAHHIFSFTDYPQLRFAINNGTTLCRSCHIKLHKINR